jgi:hypothetical protein
MIAYPDGTEAQLGDSVLLDHGAHDGMIHAVIENTAERENWNVQVPGLMVESPYYGMVFLPVHTLERDEIRFVSRRAA